jgi:hypothetical protein
VTVIRYNKDMVTRQMPLQPQQSPSASPSVRGANQEREALPVTSDEKGRCRLHGAANGSDGPPGEREGNTVTASGTKAAIAERQKFSALLKMLRAGLM